MFFIIKVGVQHGRVCTCKNSHIKSIYLQSETVVFVLCTCERTENERHSQRDYKLETLWKTRARRNQSLQPLCKTLATSSQSLNTSNTIVKPSKHYVTHERDETKALQHHVKPEHPAPQDLHFSRLYMLLCSKWQVNMDVFYIQHQPPKKHLPTKQNRHVRLMCVQTQGIFMQTDIFQRQRNWRLETLCERRTTRTQSLNPHM